jgi:hypothetical protein
MRGAVTAFNINTAQSESGPKHAKANYDPEFAEENFKSPSLNSTLGCLKVVDTLRDGKLFQSGDQ